MGLENVLSESIRRNPASDGQAAIAVDYVSKLSVHLSGTPTSVYTRMPITRSTAATASSSNGSEGDASTSASVNSNVIVAKQIIKCPKYNDLKATSVRDQLVKYTIDISARTESIRQQ